MRRPRASTDTAGALIAEVPSSSVRSGVPSDCHGPNGPSGAAWTAYTTSRPYSAGAEPKVVRVARTATRPPGRRAAVAPGSMPVPGRKIGPAQSPPGVRVQ